MRADAQVDPNPRSLLPSRPVLNGETDELLERLPTTRQVMNADAA